jgi:hypothetical protein
MPLWNSTQIVSVDDHPVEHPRVWRDRLPEKFRESGRRIAEVDGKNVWILEEDAYPNVGVKAVAGKPQDQWGLDAVRHADMIPGALVVGEGEEPQDGGNR